MRSITPCLWFDSNAEEAANFYTSIFKNSRIKDVSRYGEGARGPKGKVMVVTFELNGQPFMALNGGPKFKFTEAISMSVHCDTQEEIDFYWDRLTEGGEPVQCGWLKDRFGLSWQIVPAIIGQLMSDADPARRDRVMQAVMTMVKPDIAAMQRAADGG